jgi:hypothetical protein
MELDVPEKVQMFNFCAISVMARLWVEFPQKHFFACGHDAVGVTIDQTAAPTSFGPSDPLFVQQFCPTMDWLISERFLTGKTNGAGHYALVTLTQKGFSVLNEVPRSVATAPTPNKSLGALMREAVVSQAVRSAPALVMALSGVAVTKHLGG